jgi:hypothetical protein
VGRRGGTGIVRLKSVPRPEAVAVTLVRDELDPVGATRTSRGTDCAWAGDRAALRLPASILARRWRGSLSVDRRVSKVMACARPGRRRDDRDLNASRLGADVVGYSRLAGADPTHTNGPDAAKAKRETVELPL